MNFIPISRPTITNSEIRNVMDAVESGWVSSQGKYINLFEEGFSKFCNTKYAVAVANGTVALHLALVALGIGENDEVIIPDFTFIATANAVRYTGAKVILADIDPVTLCIDVNKIVHLITPKTKAIIPVHIYGHPADMCRLKKIADEFGLYLIEDAAEAHGAEVNNLKVGSLGDLGVFSFYGNKIITTGEGGMITTNDQKLFERMKFLRDHAMSSDKRYWHSEVGFNYRMTNLQAALGVAQLERIESIIDRKISIFQAYKKELFGFPGISLNRTESWAKNVYWMICLEVDRFDEDARDAFILELKKRGIESRPYFYPISRMGVYHSACPNKEAYGVYKKGINLPTYFDLCNDEIIEICRVIKEIV